MWYFIIGISIAAVLAHLIVRNASEVDHNFDDLLDEDEFQKEENLGI